MKSSAGTHKITFADRILTAALLFLSLSGFVFIKDVMPQGSDVNIEVNGKLLYALPLNVDRTVEVEGSIGKTVVEISGNRARIKTSPCFNSYCVHQGWISAGAVICLPNRVLVNITGHTDKKHKGIDGITG